MNILQVAAFYADFPGNFIYSLEKLEYKANLMGHNVYYAFPMEAKNIEWCQKIENRTKVFFLPLSRARIKPITYLKIKKICKDYKVDVIHSHFELYDLPCLYATIGTNKHVIWHIHDSLGINSKLYSLFYRVQYSFFGKKAKIICITDDDFTILLKMGVDKNNIYKIKNGININDIDIESNNKNIEYDFLSIGGDFYRKGFDLILNSCELLHDNGYNFKILICGNESVKEKLMEIFDNHLPKWLTFSYPVTDINKLFKISNTYVQASRYETFSFAVCEAAYSGKKIIISDVNGMKWAHDLPVVTVFNINRNNELYEAMRLSLLSDYNDTNSINTTRKIIANNYSSDIWANNIIKIYYEK